MQRIVPCLWFNDQAEAAVSFYTSIFKNSKVLGTSHYGDAGPGPKGRVMTIQFQLNGEEFLALNGGPHFKFTEAISLTVNCETQPEIDEFWDSLSAGGQPVQCGWLKDQFGLSWQVVPRRLNELLGGDDAAGSQRAMEAMLQMGKLDVAGLEAAYRGETVGASR
jgi:predicted 3-demethylubiquinone-9 3-methyltransferase (glyoxalase superfamily)